MMFWAVLNTFILTTHQFDKYPYVLLNLFLSMLAGLQGAILLIAAKRADAIAAQQSLHHLEISQATDEVVRFVKKDLAENSRLTKESHAHVAEIRRLVGEAFKQE